MVRPGGVRGVRPHEGDPGAGGGRRPVSTCRLSLRLATKDLNPFPSDGGQLAGSRTVPASGNPRELPPSRIRYVPAVTFQLWLAVSQWLNERALSVRVTWLVWPGVSRT